MGTERRHTPAGDDTQPGILFINRNTVLGGTDRILILCMRVAQSMGIRSVLACPAEGRLPHVASEMGIPVEACRFEAMQRTLNPVKLAGYARGLRREGAHVERICRKHRISLIHVHGPISAMYAVQAAKSLDLPLVCHMHEAMPPTLLHRLAWRYAAPAITQFLCVSQVIQKLATGLGFPEDRTRLLYNAIDPSFLADDIQPAEDLKGQGPHIGMVSLIVPWKGQDVFLEAAASLVDRLPTAQFHIVGGLVHPDDQPFLDKLKAAAAAPPLAGRVTISGYRNDAPRVLRAMDVVVVPSVQPEAFGLVAAEAMALGRRLVATRLGAIPEFVEDGVTGRLVSPGDAGALADAIEDLALRPDDDLMGKRAAETIRQRFTPERFGSELARIYAGLLGNRNIGPYVPLV